MGKRDDREHVAARFPTALDYADGEGDYGDEHVTADFWAKCETALAESVRLASAQDETAWRVAYDGLREAIRNYVLVSGETVAAVDRRLAELGRTLARRTRERVCSRHLLPYGNGTVSLTCAGSGCEADRA